jgi:hypothetical protein
MTDTYALVSYGMGGKAIDESASGGGGEDYLVARLEAIGVKTINSPYNWYQTQTIVDDVLQVIPKDARIALVGDSLGDNELGDILAALKGRRTIDLIGGFQGSEWGKHTTIPGDCAKAIIIYNPNVLMTGGLGAYALPLDVPPDVPSLYDGRWYTGNNGKTQVRYVQIEAPHPDDWGEAQDIVFSAIKQLAAVAA